MDFRAYLEKLRGLSDNQKKTVLWTAVIILAIIMGIFWFRATINRFSNFDGKLLNIQFPEIEIPEMQISGNETADWQSYINEEYGFEIRIPKEWVIQKISDGLKFTTEDILKQKEENTLCLKKGGQDCDAGELPYAVAYFKYMKKDGDKFSSEDLINGSSQFKLNEIQWTRYQRAGMLADIHFRAVGETDKGYDFLIFWDEDEPVLKQILSTFKFIE